MAHFARIDINSIVQEVLVVPNEQEHRGSEYLSQDLKLGGVWKQTSYNTVSGTHLLGGTPFRKNYAGLGYYYDESRDAFIPPKPFPSWLLNEETCTWYPPVPEPQDEFEYYWNEENQEWNRLEL